MGADEKTVADGKEDVLHGSKRSNPIFAKNAVLPSADRNDDAKTPKSPTTPKASDIEMGSVARKEFLSKASTVNGGEKSPFDAFVESERARRVAKADTSNPIFISHCWKNPDTSLQDRKWQMIEVLSRPLDDPRPSKGGLAYWADWLDLQAQGPIAWRQEIEQGIRNSSKVVAFIDSFYLRSPNCIQELAFSRAFQKPVVVVIQDQGAFDVITKPSREGALEAWGDGTDERHLCRWEGMDLVPGEVSFSLDVLKELYQMVANINVCPMREADFDTLGEAGMLKKVLSFVNKDMAHMKSHARWLLRAQEWDRLGRPRHALLRAVALREFEHWLLDSSAKNLEPAPTPLHQQFLQKCLKRERRSRSAWSVLAIVIFLVVLGLAGFSAYKAVSATQAQQAALIAKRVSALEAAESRVDLLVTSAISYTSLDPYFSLQLAAEAVIDAQSLDERYRAHAGIAKVLSETRGSSSSPSQEFWGHSGTVTALAHSGTVFMSGSKDGTSRIYNSSGALLCVLTGHNGTVKAVALSSAFSLGISGGADGTLRFYNTSTCASLGAVPSVHRGSITALATNDPTTPESAAAVVSNRPAQWSTPAGGNSTSGNRTAAANSTAGNSTTSPPGRNATAPPPSGGNTTGLNTTGLNATGLNATGGVGANSTGVGGPQGSASPPPAASGPPSAGSPPATSAPAPVPPPVGGGGTPPLGTGGPPPLAAGRRSRRGLLQGSPTASTSSPGGGSAPAAGVSTKLTVVSGDSTGTVVAWVLDLSAALGATSAAAIVAMATVSSVSIGHQVGALAVTADGTEVAVAGNGATLRMWNIASNRVTNFTGHNGFVMSVELDGTGDTMISGGDDRTIRVWDTGTSGNRSDSGSMAMMSTLGAVSDIKIAPDSYLIASAELDGYVRIYDLEDTGKAIANVRCWLKSGTKYGTESVLRVALQNSDLTSSGKFACTRDDNSFAAYNADASAKSDTSLQLSGHTGPIVSLSFSADGSLVASASMDGTIKVWSAKFSPDNGGGQYASLVPNYGAASAGTALAVAFKPGVNGTTIAGGGTGTKVSVWTAAVTGTDANADTAPTFQLTGHTNAVTALAWSKDGSLLASGSLDSKVLLWNGTAPHTLVASLSSPSGCAVKSVSFQPDGLYLASADSCGKIYIWTVGSRTVLKTLAHHPGVTVSVNSVRWSPSSSLLASAGSDYALVLWSTDTWTRVSTLSGHTDVVEDCSFSPDGERLMSIGGADSNLRLWDPDTCTNGELWPSNTGRSGAAGLRYMALALSTDRVAAGDSSGVVSVQPFEPRFQMVAALSRVYNGTRLSTPDKALVLGTSGSSCSGGGGGESRRRA